MAGVGPPDGDLADGGLGQFGDGPGGLVLAVVGALELVDLGDLNERGEDQP